MALSHCWDNAHIIDQVSSALSAWKPLALSHGVTTNTVNLIHAIIDRHMTLRSTKYVLSRASRITPVAAHPTIFTGNLPTRGSRVTITTSTTEASIRCAPRSNAWS